MSSHAGTWILRAGTGRGVAFIPATLEELNEAGDNVVVRPLEPIVRMPPTSLGWRAAATPGLTPILESVRSIARELFESATPGSSTTEIVHEPRPREATVRDHVAPFVAHTRLQAVTVGS